MATTDTNNSVRISENRLLKANQTLIQSPKNSPKYLRPVRAMVVGDKNESMSSLLAAKKSDRMPNSGKDKHAEKLLSKRILSGESDQQGGYMKFSDDRNNASRKSSSLDDAVLKKGNCLLMLSGNGMTQWGVRRQVMFISNNTTMVNKATPDHPNVLSEENITGEESEEKDETKVEISQDNNGSSKQYSKRKRCTRESDTRSVLVRQKPKKQKLLKNSKDRWSAERYKVAERNMLKILQTKRAVHGNPILRPELRSEARKKIGDTGLLDHLLKHMAGKLAPGGKERFRRRHNADGAMEYWLESADLLKVRKEAGVHDPYWTPPPGWQPGDSPHQDPICAKELRQLKEEMAKIKKFMQQLSCRRRQDESDEADNNAVALIPKSCGSLDHIIEEADSTSLLTLKEKHEELLKKKVMIEKQLVQLSHSFTLVQEEMCALAFKVEQSVKSQTDLQLVLAKPNKEQDEIENAAEDDQMDQEMPRQEQKKTADDESDNMKRRQKQTSGFRVCKPQGTFLWPTSTNAFPLHPSPSSSSSAADPFPIPPSPPAFPSSPRKPLTATETLTSDHFLTAGTGKKILLNLNEIPAASTSGANYSIPIPPCMLACEETQRMVPLAVNLGGGQYR